MTEPSADLEEMAAAYMDMSGDSSEEEQENDQETAEAVKISAAVYPGDIQRSRQSRPRGGK